MTDTSDEEWIYRAMVEDEGQPAIGVAAIKLGIRPGYDIEVDEDNNVHRPTFEPGEKNGLSCSPAIHQLPIFALPESHGGTNRKTVVWRIRADQLGPELEAQADQDNHISIGPAETMTIDEYSAAIESLAPFWEKIP